MKRSETYLLDYPSTQQLVNILADLHPRDRYDAANRGVEWAMAHAELMPYNEFATTWARTVAACQALRAWMLCR